MLPYVKNASQQRHLALSISQISLRTVLLLGLGVLLLLILPSASAGFGSIPSGGSTLGNALSSGHFRTGLSRGLNSGQFIDRFVNRNMRTALPSATSDRHGWGRRSELDTRNYNGQLNGEFGRFRTGATAMYSGSRQRGVPTNDVNHHFMVDRTGSRWNTPEVNFFANHN